MTANDIKFRCSSLGHLAGDNGITEKQLITLNELLAKPNPTEKQKEYIKDLTEKRDSKELSQGVITHLVDCYVSAAESRREEAFGKALTKGNEREEDSITLLSLHRNAFFKKNDERLSNHFIQGEPDLFTGNTIREAEHIIDIKTSWSRFTHLRTKFKPLDKMYYFQVQGYMALTGAKTAEVAFCLVNGTAMAINDEKRKVLWLGGGEETEAYKEYAKQIEINHIFDIENFTKENPGFIFDNEICIQADGTVNGWEWDIPEEKRIFSFKVERNQADIDKLYKQITDCREWMDANLFKSVKEIAHVA